MTRIVTPDMLNGFADEVRGYLAELAPIVTSLDLAAAESFEIGYRRSHSIRGTAGLLNLHALSRLARIQEEAFEALMEGRLSHSPIVTALLNQTFAGIARSIDFHLNRPIDQIEQVRAALISQRRLQGLPIEADEAVIQEELDSIRKLSGPVAGESSELPEVPVVETRKKKVTRRKTKPKSDPEPVEADVFSQAIASRNDDDELYMSLREQFASLEGMDAEYAAIYQEDSLEMVSQIRDELDKLKIDPDDRVVLKTLRRLFHNLKGAAATVRLKPAATLAHRVEDVLDWLHDHEIAASTANHTLLAQVVDTLEDLASLRFDRDEMLTRTIRLIGEMQNATRLTSGLAQTESESSSPNSAPSKYAGIAGPSDGSQLPRTTLESVAPAFIDVDSAFAATPLELNSTGATNPVAMASKTGSPASGDGVRVPLDSLDDMTRLVGELVVNRTGFEQRLTQFRSAVGELRLAMQRMQALSRKFDEHYEVRALAKGSLLWPNAGSDQPRNSAVFNNSQDFDDLEFDRYTEFHLLSRQLAETISDLGAMGMEFGGMTSDFDSLLTRQTTISRDLQGRLMQARLLPLGGLMSRLRRIVRVTGETLNKPVELQLEGAGVHLDKSALDELYDPLTHLLRNAVAHGIESADTRATRGKPAQGRIILRAFHQGTQVVIEVSDDGGGLDLAGLRTAAIRHGLLTAEQADSLSSEDIHQLAFLHGLSTAGEVNEISGRGVGLDVVQSTVQRLKGTITVKSSPAGTTFSIRLPMTLALTKALLIRVGEGTFAIPMQDVQQIVRVERSQLEKVGTAPVLRLGGQVFPLETLADRLHQTSSVDSSSTSVPVLFVRTGEGISAVAIDQIISAREIVVKTLGTHLRNLRGFLGATFLGDGTVVPILNCFELLRSATRTISRRVDSMNPDGQRSAVREVHQAPTVLIVDDSVSVRRITAKLLGSAGMKTILARDGVDALEILQGLPDLPDLILLDVEMPRMDGYELLATLRGQAQYTDLPVVMVTSRAGAKHRAKAAELGATEYLVKPYNEDELVPLIRRHITAYRESETLITA